MVFKGLFLKGIYGREMFETWYKMVAMLQGGLDLAPVVTHRFPIDRFQEGFDVMRSGQSGKVDPGLGRVAEPARRGRAPRRVTRAPHDATSLYRAEVRAGTQGIAPTRWHSPHRPGGSSCCDPVTGPRWTPSNAVAIPGGNASMKPGLLAGLCAGLLLLTVAGCSRPASPDGVAPAASAPPAAVGPGAGAPEPQDVASS